MFLRLTCRRAAELLIAREDRAIGMSDQLALKLHLMACAACPEFENQVLTLRAAMNKWREGSLDAEVTAGQLPPVQQNPKLPG